MSALARGLVAACALALGLAPAAAVAEVETVRIAQGFGLGYLPQLVMRERGLIEKQAAAAGMPNLKASWMQLGSGVAMNEALLSGSLDFASGGVAPMILLWDKAGSRLGVRGVAALSSLNNFMNTTRPDLKSLADIKPTDRIAVPAGGVHQLILRMAAEQAFGPGQHARLDPLIRPLAHPDGYNAMMIAKDVDANFTTFPFQEQELADPSVHRVMSSYDVLQGPATFLLVWTTDKFRRDNPKVFGIYLAALEEATAWINGHKRQAAELFAAAERGATADQVLAFMKSPDLEFTTTPQRTLTYAAFMQRIGMISRSPTTWQELFHPEIAGKPGS